MPSQKIVRCTRCNRRKRRNIEPGNGEWNMVLRAGYVVGHLCPGCQTAEENAEATVNEATGETASMTWYRPEEHTREENIGHWLQSVWQSTQRTIIDWVEDHRAAGEDWIDLNREMLTDRAMAELPAELLAPTPTDSTREVVREHVDHLMDRWYRPAV